MKLAFSGKGGVGKSTLCAAVCGVLAERGVRVLAVDADPDGSLGSCLGIEPAVQREKIVPVARQRALIEQRTGARVRQYGQMFTLNPEVSDIADTQAYTRNGVSLLVLGAVESGGGGCACPENVLLRALVSDLVLHRNEALVMDMEAGVEHLGRATASGVDTMFVVVEPGLRSVESTRRVLARCADLGLADVRLVLNKVTGVDDERYVRTEFPSADFAAVVPYDGRIKANERACRPVLDEVDIATRRAVEQILEPWN